MTMASPHDVSVICDPWTRETPPSTRWTIQRVGATSRITEDAILRITEQGVIRIIERCLDAGPVLDARRTTEDGEIRETEYGSVRVTE